jgi:hypothetical protein
MSPPSKYPCICAKTGWMGLVGGRSVSLGHFWVFETSVEKVKPAHSGDSESA